MINFIENAAQAASVTEYKQQQRTVTFENAEDLEAFKTAFVATCAEELTVKAQGRKAEVLNENGLILPMVLKCIQEWQSVAGQADKALLRELLNEEIKELHGEKYPSNAWFKELADCVYIKAQIDGTCGDFLKDFKDLDKAVFSVIFRAVHLSNMTKFLKHKVGLAAKRKFKTAHEVQLINGYYIGRRKDGKIVKPVTYKPFTDFYININD